VPHDGLFQTKKAKVRGEERGGEAETRSSARPSQVVKSRRKKSRRKRSRKRKRNFIDDRVRREILHSTPKSLSPLQSVKLAFRLFSLKQCGTPMTSFAYNFSTVEQKSTELDAFASHKASSLTTPVELTRLGMSTKLE
jgi:hypothetical protein